MITRRCKFCHAQCDGSYPYHLGPVHGHLCRECGDGLDGAIGAWARERTAELAQRREQALAERRAAIRLAAEALPLSTRRAMAEGRKAG